MKKNRKILFVLSGNLSTTPRAVKNIKLAGNYFLVDVVKVNRSLYWTNLDEKIEYELNLSSVSINPGRSNFFTWIKTQIIYNISRFLSIFFRKSLKLAAYSSQKVCIPLTQRLSISKEHYDLVIGHGSGTLYPVFSFAKKINIPFALDIEDYHPGEEKNPVIKKRTELLMKSVLPEANYVTYASPLILENSLKLLNKKIHTDLNEKENEDAIYPGRCPHIVVNNSFPSSEFQFQASGPELLSLNLVWFSQNIAHNRGLEQIIQALTPFRNEVKLYLIGHLYDTFDKEWITPNRDFITTLSPLSQEGLHKLLTGFDIGLAIELNKTDFNRQICLTNKIFAYTQAGLFTLATDTPAQKLFMDKYPWSGTICSQNTKDMQVSIRELLNKKEQIRANKKQRYQNARSLAWEKESKKLLKIWEESSKLEARSSKEERYEVESSNLQGEGKRLSSGRK